jgi:hypothetical protein
MAGFLPLRNPAKHRAAQGTNDFLRQIFILKSPIGDP